jgi:hypothetical protein
MDALPDGVMRKAKAAFALHPDRSRKNYPWSA